MGAEGEYWESGGGFKQHHTWCKKDAGFWSGRSGAPACAWERSLQHAIMPTAGLQVPAPELLLLLLPVACPEEG